MSRLAPLALLLSGCLTLDSFVHNPVHCSTVGPDSCARSSVWDNVCLPCDEPYDWGATYPWFDGQLEDGQTIRPIDPSTVVALSLETDDGLGTLDAYFVPAHGDEPALASTTVFYHHGNYAGIEHYLPRLRMLHEAGYALFVYDYRGYGKSLPASAPSPAQFLADARTVRDAIDTVVPDPDRLVIYANSLGSIPAIEAAAHRRPCATVLEAPFISLGEAAQGNTTAGFGDGFFSEGLFDNVAAIARTDAPTFVMVGELDNKFTPAQTRTLFDAAPSPKRFWEVPDTRHGISNVGIPEASFTAYADQIRAFLVEEAPGCVGP